MKSIKALSMKDLEITIKDDAVNISTSLREVCPHCDTAYCFFDCHPLPGLDDDEKDDIYSRLGFNGAITGIEELLVALVDNGFDVSHPDFIDAIQTAIEACREI